MSADTAQPTTPPEAEMDMGALLDLEASQAGGQLRRGEIIEGMVMGASPDGLIVDVGTKTEAVIPQNEMLSLGVDGASKLKTGDTVRVMVLQPSTAEGHAIVSLDRARGEEGWETLQRRFQTGEIFEAQVTGHNRGGLLVNVDGVNAFVPLSQVESVRRDDPDAPAQLANLVGQPIKLKVIELNRKRNRVILSERAAMAEVRKEQKERVLDELQEGQIRTGRISSITDFGVFIDLGGADGLAHMTELTWERGKKARDLFQVGDEVQAYILKIDRENKKISLSIKRAQPERWDTTVDRFVIGQILIGRITKLMPFGAFVRLEGPVEGLIHISELSNRRIQHPKEIVKEGDVVPVKLVRIEKDRHRLGLSLRQARNDAEAMGFLFDANGSVIDYPDDVREQFGLPPRDTTTQPPRREPRTTQEAIEQAVSRDPEPISAFAAAFAQALENAEAGNGLADTVAQVAGLAPKDEPAPPAAEEPASITAEEPASITAETEAPENTGPASEAPATEPAQSGITEQQNRVSTGATTPDAMPQNTSEGTETAPTQAPAATEEETADGS
ncbi:S1 RNA-binding domain-containing protein [Tepidiforma sp.]|uniref:30S ribosomal protein S1 n=1 Tax=Tepidiforma sp. TaxID=2682230 RepID=UPI002ADDC1AA|nr:S1 RNA-binding domain-containing protein [Tepidiforma sp.]